MAFAKLLSQAAPATVLGCRLSIGMHPAAFKEGLEVFWFFFFFLFQKAKKTSGNLRIGLCEKEEQLPHSLRCHCSLFRYH